MKLIAPVIAAICVCSAPLVQAKNYVEAKALSAQLKPQGLTSKPDSDGLNKVRGQVARILTAMEESEVNAGPGGQELLSTAYSMFRPDVGPIHRMAAVGALVAVQPDDGGSARLFAQRLVALRLVAASAGCQHRA